ncbi:hypothetical protein OJ254_06190 [Streptomyces endophytica]|uniref:Methyltransferase type 11 domain-containing protein n=1 Tax=Streptomyces endophytica TaxID=2991496 RepID=A0ABY6PA65_9ACTN|nr:hypothetical protein [Streptomyces endophytica]UZJ30082.1 hypothetical protein OJ254_06190 [Streptomyces endophytica]
MTTRAAPPRPPPRARRRDFDWAAMADLLELEGEVHSPYVRQAFEELTQLSPRRVLDIGSGPGWPPAAGGAVPAGRGHRGGRHAGAAVRARERAERLGVPLRTRVAEFPAGLADLGPADWCGPRRSCTTSATSRTP